MLLMHHFTSSVSREKLQVGVDCLAIMTYLYEFLNISRRRKAMFLIRRFARFLMTALPIILLAVYPTSTPLAEESCRHRMIILLVRLRIPCFVILTNAALFLIVPT